MLSMQVCALAAVLLYAVVSVESVSPPYYYYNDKYDCSGGLGTKYCMNEFGYYYSCYQTYFDGAQCLYDFGTDYDIYDHGYDGDEYCGGDRGTGHCMDEFAYDWSCFDTLDGPRCLQDDIGPDHYSIYQYDYSDDADCSGGLGTKYCMNQFDWSYSCYDTWYAGAQCLSDYGTDYDLYDHGYDGDEYCGGDRGTRHCMDEFAYDWSCFDTLDGPRCLQDDIGPDHYSIYQYVSYDDADCSGGLGTKYCMNQFDWSYSCYDTWYAGAQCMSDYDNSYYLYDHGYDGYEYCGGGRGTSHCMNEFAYDWSCFDTLDGPRCLQDDIGPNHYQLY